MLSNELKELQESRGSKYGPFLKDMAGASHIMMTLLAHRMEVLGCLWAAEEIRKALTAGLLDDMAPAFMCDGIKAMRKATGNYLPDNHKDSTNYDWAREQLLKEMQPLIKEWQEQETE